MNEINLNHLRTYIQAFGDALSIARLERRLHMPERSLRHWIKGEQGLAAWHVDKVHAWATFFGYDPTRQYDSII